MLSGTAIAIDFETTGQVRQQRNAPWQIGLARLDFTTGVISPLPGHYLQVPEDFSFNPYTPGRWAELRKELSLAPKIGELWQELAPLLLDTPLIAHNAATERTILKQEFPLHKFVHWIDTLSLCRQAYPHLENYSLSALLECFQLTRTVQALCPGMEPHNAEYDAAGAAVLLHHILQLPGWNRLDLNALEELSRKKR